MRTRWLMAALAGGLVTVAAPSLRADLPAVGKLAPPWSGKTVDGKALTSAQYKGKVVLLNFFSYT